LVDNLSHFIDPQVGGGKFVQNMGNYTWQGFPAGLSFQVKYLHNVNIFNIAVLLSVWTEVIFLTCILEMSSSNLGQDGELA